MEYEKDYEKLIKLIEKHKDILEFRNKPYNERAYIEEFLKLAEKKVKTNISDHKPLFLCDMCGKQKSGNKLPVYNENWSDITGLHQCEDCFKKSCGID
jgi:hypothetical protein